MLLLMKQQGRRVLGARNVHRAFLNACVLLDIPVQWIYPRKSDGILSGTYDLADFEATLQAQTRPACVYVTSPDYLGRMADIAGLAELCPRYHAKLLVDRIQTAILNTIPIWKGQIVIALGLQNQQKTLRLQQDIMDATNDLQKNVLKYKPFLIKPNNFELGELFGVTLHSREEIEA